MGETGGKEDRRAEGGGGTDGKDVVRGGKCQARRVE